MITAICPKLPMRNKALTLAYYENLGFTTWGGEYEHYLMMKKDGINLHFFLFESLDPAENYGQVYFYVDNIEAQYEHFLSNKIAIHPNGPLGVKPWGQKEFSLLDPDHNLLTFGQKA